MRGPDAAGPGKLCIDDARSTGWSAGTVNHDCSLTLTVTR